MDLKFHLFLKAAPPDPTLEGVSGKIDKLCKPPTDGNVQKCQDELDGGQVNIPRTADLFICYETSAGDYDFTLFMKLHLNVFDFSFTLYS